MSGYFYGWYFKCQSEDQTLAVIPAVHGAGRKRTCSIQVITENDVWTVTFPFSSFQQTKDNIIIANNRFGKRGISLDISTSEISIKGRLCFTSRTPIHYDIMGPFVFVPYMECRHSVYSMQHRVDGRLLLNGNEYRFENALGYWEGDRGRSFPKEYAWTQCFIENELFRREQSDISCQKAKEHDSLMLSIADIPLAGIHFTGIISIIRWKGKEYRLATYLGARVIQKSNHRLLVRQGNMEFEARLLEKNAHPLQAPVSGAMTRTIRENVRCKAFYRLRKHGQTIFAFETEQASFEYEY